MNIKKTIDKMVEASIRSLLPSILEEILLEKVVNLTKSLNEKNNLNGLKKIRKSNKVDLTNLLDESAGSEFYENYENSKKINNNSGFKNLNPQLKEMAVDIMNESVHEESVANSLPELDFEKMKKIISMG